MRIRFYVLPILLLGSSLTCAHARSFTSLQQNVFQYIGQPNSRPMYLPIIGGYRLYNSDIGQFLKQDAYSPFQGGRTLNGFNYAGGNPIFLLIRVAMFQEKGECMHKAH